MGRVDGWMDGWMDNWSHGILSTLASTSFSCHHHLSAHDDVWFKFLSRASPTHNDQAADYLISDGR